VFLSFFNRPPANGSAAGFRVIGQQAIGVTAKRKYSMSLLAGLWLMTG
jgi:hypothetical protein